MVRELRSCMLQDMGKGKKKKRIWWTPPVSPPSVMAADSPLMSQTKLLTQYVLSLAKYDQNYDIRDRRASPGSSLSLRSRVGALSRHARSSSPAPKPAPVLGRL